MRAVFFALQLLFAARALFFGAAAAATGPADKRRVSAPFSLVAGGKDKPGRPIPSSAAAAWEKSRSLSGVEQSQARRMIKQGSLNGYRMAMQDLLNGPAYEFVRAVSSLPGGKLLPLSEITKSVYNEMTLAAAPWPPWGNKTAVPEFYQEAVDLLIAATPPLMKKDRSGLTAWESALIRENQPLLKVFQRHKRIRSSFELDISDQSSLWSRNIPLVPLQGAPLAQAVLAEDAEAFWKELEALFEGPAKELLSVLHSRTSGGASIFHLAAGVSSHREEFAAGMDALITFIAPTIFNFQKTSQSESEADKFLRRAGAAAFLLGLSAAGAFAFTGHSEAAYAAGAVSAAGTAGLCRWIFYNKDTDSVIRSLL